MRPRQFACILIFATMSAQPVRPQSDLAQAVGDWRASPHADRQAGAFRHWDEEGEIPPDCARCHSAPGLADFLGADGSAAGTVEHSSPIGTVIGCASCHAPEAEGLTEIALPSGAVVGRRGADTVCMVCHMGRTGGATVDEATAGHGPDELMEGQDFINIHYAPAAAMRLGAGAGAGYEFATSDYAGRFAHVDGFDGCAECHEPHTTRVRMRECATCHADAEELEAPKARLAAARQGLREALAGYSAGTGHAVAYDPASYPYFFEDLNGDGAVNEDERGFSNRYAHWTPRALRAAYNLHFAQKDAGAYAHNPDYALQLLIDSIESLGIEVEPGARPR